MTTKSGEVSKQKEQTEQLQTEMTNTKQKSKTCENEKIQYCRTHPNQILNFGLEIPEYFHTEPPLKIRTHRPTQHYKIPDININHQGHTTLCQQS
jgi:hypothetical protein